MSTGWVQDATGPTLQCVWNKISLITETLQVSSQQGDHNDIFGLQKLASCQSQYLVTPGRSGHKLFLLHHHPINDCRFLHGRFVATFLSPSVIGFRSFSIKRLQSLWIVLDLETEQKTRADVCLPFQGFFFFYAHQVKQYLRSLSIYFIPKGITIGHYHRSLEVLISCKEPSWLVVVMYPPCLLLPPCLPCSQIPLSSPQHLLPSFPVHGEQPPQDFSEMLVLLSLRMYFLKSQETSLLELRLPVAVFLTQRPQLLLGSVLATLPPTQVQLQRKL